MEKETDVTGPALRELRIKQGKTQKEFWGEVLVAPSTGAYYESNRSPLTPLTRRICYLHFVLGIGIMTTTPEIAEKVKEQANRINRLASELRNAAKLIEQSGTKN